MTDLAKQDLATLSRGLREKKFSSVELTKAYLDRIRTHDKKLNSFITVLEEQALTMARAADARIAKNENVTPLTGIPIAQKDIFCTENVLTTCGSKILANFVSPYDATIVSRFNAAGTVLIGKTNMDEFAMGSSNENSYFGPVKNPWDLSKVPGGSSGGTAAAVAARLVAGATGTDTGGSIRQPAAFCGITGIKPTYGRVSRYGMIAFASSLDQGGPMTQTAADAAIMLNAMAGFDEKDSTSVNIPVPDYTASLNEPLTGLRIGVPQEYFSADLDPRIAALLEQALKVYEQLGATRVPVRLPNSSFSIPVYYVVAPAEASSNLARYDGVRFGYRCANPRNLEDLYKRSRGEGFGAEVKRRIMIGTYVLSAGYYDAYYLKAQKIRHLIADDFKTAFKDVDVIIGPTTPSSAFATGAKINDPVSMYLSDIYTVPANLAGLPAMSLPVGFIEGLPIGMQLVGNYFKEAKLLNVANLYQKQTDWHQQLPQGF